MTYQGTDSTISRWAPAVTTRRDTNNNGTQKAAGLFAVLCTSKRDVPAFHVHRGRFQFPAPRQTPGPCCWSRRYRRDVDVWRCASIPKLLVRYPDRLCGVTTLAVALHFTVETSSREVGR
jgi:hypothetical protein